MRYRQYLAVALAATIAAACGGGGAASGGTPTETTPPANGGGTLASLALSPTSGTVPVGGSFQLTATPKDAAGNALSGLPAPTFVSSDPAKATVDGNGLVTGLAAGAVTIRATLTAGGATHTATADLTVTAPPPPPPSATFTSLTLSPDAGSVNVGGTLQLTATPRDQNGAAMAGLPAPTFSTSDASRATVDASGVVRGVAAGAVTITASLTAGGVTRQAAASVTVVAPPAPPAPSTAAVAARRSGYSPPAVTIAVGGTVTWTMVDDDHTVTFYTIAPDGGSAGRTEEGTSVSRKFSQPGTYAYHCTRHEIQGTVEVKAGGDTPQQPPTYTSLTVSPSSGSVQVGATLQLAATPRDQYGAAMSGLGSAQWSSSSSAVATVSASGLVTGVAAGTATITATLASGGTTKTATATITVTTTTAPPPPPPPPGNSTATVTTPGESFSPQTVTIAAGGTVTWQISGATHNVTFSGAAPTGGSIPDTRSGTSVSRTFPTAGTYNYQCTRHSGMTGQVVVQ